MDAAAAQVDDRTAHRGRTLFGRPVILALIAAEKAGSCILAGAGAWLAFFVHSRAVQNPLYLLFPGEMAESPRDVVVGFIASHLPPLGPRLVLAIAILLIFWTILLGLEAIGVWFDLAWGEVLIIVETVSLLPVSIYDIARHPAPTGFLGLTVNLLILWYVARLYQRRMARRAAAHAVGYANVSRPGCREGTTALERREGGA